MTTPEPFSSRPVPDVADLRLLGEIINHGAVGLPQAAWNAGMSQSEAAARLVTMAERGMPLRLVAEGDRQQLWQIAQAGPVSPMPPVPPLAPAVPPVPTMPPASVAAPVPPAAGNFFGRGDEPAPTTGPILTAGAAPDAGSGSSAELAPGTGTGSAAVWGVPGSSDWVRPPEENPAGVDPAPAGQDTEPQSSSDTASREEASTDAGFPDAGSSDGPSPADSEPDGSEPDTSESDTSEPAGTVSGDANTSTRRVLTSGEPVQAVQGLFGEQLDVGLQQILDPADSILTAVGYRIDAGERALLVQTSVGNRGPADHESPADLYLELLDAAGTVMRKAAMSVNGYPAHQVGVPANTWASGWTVFLVPVDTEVAQVRWSVRPDLADRTVSWGFGPAPADDH